MYKLCIYKTLHFDNDDLDHEEFSKMSRKCTKDTESCYMTE